jgi:phage-related protein
MLKALVWVGSAKEELKELPEEIQDEFGYALYLAQIGEMPRHAKPFKGHGSGVSELVESFDGNAYRALYLVRYEEATYVLHCFQKKSKSGIGIPPRNLELIKQRLRAAEAIHARWREG